MGTRVVRSVMAFCSSCLLLSAASAGAAPGYQRFLVGNPEDVVTPTSGLLVLQGGGTDVDENFVRMGARAGGGDFVVIRASGTDAYNPYIYSLCSCDSVETFIFKNRNAAFDPFPGTPESMAALMQTDAERWARYVRAAKIEPQ